MTPRYYVFENDSEQPKHEFVSPESMVSYFHQSTEVEGEFRTNYSGIKVKYNIHDGNVFLISIENRKWLVNFFSPDAFQHLIKPVSDAISLLAKWKLLLDLHELGDEGISKIICHNHIDKVTGELVHLNINAVHHTLYQIRNYNRPSFADLFKRIELSDVQKHVCSILNQYRLENIKAKKDSESIIKSIKERLDIEEPSKDDNDDFKPTSTAPAA